MAIIKRAENGKRDKKIKGNLCIHLDNQWVTHLGNCLGELSNYLGDG